MKTKIVINTFGCLTILLQIGGQAYADVKPQECYALQPGEYSKLVDLDKRFGKLSKTELNHEIDKLFQSQETLQDHYDAREYIHYKDKFKKIKIDISYTQEKPDSIISFDASSSYAPGKIQYIWKSHGTSGFMHSDNSKSTNTMAPFDPGYRTQLKFEINDPVCGLHEATLVNVINKK